MHLLSRYIQKNSTKVSRTEIGFVSCFHIVAQPLKEEIDEFLKNVCDKSIPATLRDSCRQFVDEYEPVIVAVLTDNTSTDKFCQLMHFCIGDFSNEVKTEVKLEGKWS
jgi:hypothetical protein